MSKSGEKILAGAAEALAFARGERAGFMAHGFHPRQGWAELASYADACVDLDLSPDQEIQRLSMVLAMVEEITAGVEQEADAATERPRNVGFELLKTRC